MHGVMNVLTTFCIIFLKPLFCNLLSSVRNSTVYLGQDLKHVPFEQLLCCFLFTVCNCCKPFSFESSSVVPILLIVSAQFDLDFLKRQVTSLLFSFKNIWPCIVHK